MTRVFRPLVAAAFLVLSFWSAAPAAPPPPGDRAEAFAICAGRLWALSVLPDAASDRQAQRWRVDGWVQIAHLLARNQYGATPRRRDLAATRMASRIATCRRMILRR